MLERGSPREGGIRPVAIGVALLALGTLVGSCQTDRAETAESSSAVLRVGIGQLSATNPLFGIRQLTQIITVEGLGRLEEDGRVFPWVADKWETGADGRSLIVTLKPGVKFHDGSLATSEAVSAFLPAGLRSAMGSVAEDVEHVKPAGPNAIEIGFRHRSPFLLEALEAQIRKPGQAIVATGPFVVAPNSTTELRANVDYYLGRPKIDVVQIQMFPSVRAAWAELLRNRIDMLYEVGLDALDSLESSSSVMVPTYVRHYQYVMALNTALPSLRSSAVRHALNIAIDRQELVRRALRDRGVPSTGPISPRYWALKNDSQVQQDGPTSAAAILKGKRIRFTCLLPNDQISERIAIELKRQFANVGVEMNLRAAPQDEIFEAERAGTFEAFLSEFISGPTVLRPYQLWHTKGSGNPEGRLGNAAIDAAFDKVRYAEDEETYRSAVAQLQKTFLDDPPAIFLAWSERARAITKRYVVPPAPPGRDVLGTLRLWTPRENQRIASRN